MKALGLVVSDKKIFENCILKTYFLTPWPTYATSQNYLNNFGRGPPRDHSCEVWSKSNKWFQRRRCLSKKVYGRRTTDDGRRTTDDARRTTTDDGQRPVTIAHPEHFVLRWAKNNYCFQADSLACFDFPDIRYVEKNEQKQRHECLPKNWDPSFVLIIQNKTTLWLTVFHGDSGSFEIEVHRNSFSIII